MSEKQTQILVGIGVPCDMLGGKQTGQFDERRDLCWPLDSSCSMKASMDL